MSSSPGSRQRTKQDVDDLPWRRRIRPVRTELARPPRGNHREAFHKIGAFAREIEAGCQKGLAFGDRTLQRTANYLIRIHQDTIQGPGLVRKLLLVTWGRLKCRLTQAGPADGQVGTGERNFDHRIEATCGSGGVSIDQPADRIGCDQPGHDRQDQNRHRAG